MSPAARNAEPGRATGPVAIAIADAAAAGEVARVLAARGLACDRVGVDPRALDDAVAGGAAALAAVIAADAEPAALVALAAPAQVAASAGRPLVILAPPVRITGKAGAERAAALARLRAAGAVVCGDPDAWLEALVMIARFGVPAGPRVAVVAPPASWVEAQGLALGDDAGRVASRAAELEPADVVLVDRALLAEVPSGRAARALVVPVIARAELLADDRELDVLVGLRAALAAVIACGRAGERIAAGLGPAPLSARDELEIDEERVRRQLDKMQPHDRRLGDHEAKVLLAAYGVPVIRQAVATTPSAATRIAKKAGYPVELKPWGPDVPSERAGCPIERNVSTAAEVRRAYTAVLGAVPGSPSSGGNEAVIVREAAPSGRELSATISRIGAAGWTVMVDVAGAPPLAAPAPLRVVDATSLAAAVTATRGGEAEPDRVALANLLRRASHLAVDHDGMIERIELGRIVVGSRGGKTLVVDAEILLKSR